MRFATDKTGELGFEGKNNTFR